MNTTISLDDIVLKSGAHKSIEEGACIMEMVSYIANEPWSDHPQCACPILTEYAIRMNDKFTDEDRQKLKPLIPLLINTRLEDAAQIARKRFMMWRNVTVTYPLILDLIGAKEYAEKLRTFENTKESMASAAAWLDENKDAIRKIANAYAYTNAFRTLRTKLSDTDGANHLAPAFLLLVEALGKVLHPDHKEPDDYTRLACAQHTANEALKQAAKLLQIEGDER